MQRHHTDEQLEGLSAEAVREVQERASRRKPLASGPVPKTDTRRELLAALASRQALRRAILLQEVLGPPKALQP